MLGKCTFNHIFIKLEKDFYIFIIHDNFGAKFNSFIQRNIIFKN